MVRRTLLCALAILVSHAPTSVTKSRDAAGDAKREHAVSVTVAEIEGLIARVGTRSALKELSQNASIWEQVLREISAGSAAWLEIAARLEGGSDAGPGEQLVLAMQDALPASPHSVLKLVKKGSFSVVHVCGGYGPTQMEDRRPKSIALVLIHTRRERVGAVVEPSLTEVKKACLQQLAKLEHDVRATTPWPPEYD